MKKKIIICIFLLLILTTLTLTIIGAIDSYNYEMDPANGVDILEGFGAVFILMIGGFIVLYELDLLYTSYYFLSASKTKAKSILNILSNLSLLLIFFSEYLVDVLYKHFNIFKEDWIFPIILFFIYIILRLAYFLVATCNTNTE